MDVNTKMVQKRFELLGRYVFTVECADNLTPLESRELKVLFEREVFLLQGEPAPKANR